MRIDAEEAELGASKAVIQIIKDSEKLLRSIRRHSTSESRNDLYKSELQRSKDILNGLEVEKKKAYGRLDLLIQNGSQEKVKQYVKDFEDSVDKIDKEISILKSKIESLEKAQSGNNNTFFDELKDKVKIAQKIQDMVQRKADPVLVKAAYKKLFRAIVAEPCPQTGTYKLKFVIGDNSNSPTVTTGGHGSFMERMVGSALEWSNTRNLWL